MSKEYRIEKGDTVKVDINAAQITLLPEAEVAYIPQATGDSWIFLDPKNKNRPVYVSEGCTITLLVKKTIVDFREVPF